MAVLVGTVDGYRIVSSAGEVRSALSGHRVEAFSPGPGGEWIAIVDRHEIWRHRADGEWSPLARGDADLACLETVDGDVFAGAVGPELLRVEGDRLVPVADLDAIAGRAEWHPVGWALHVRSMSATADGVLLANVHVGGIIRSDDRGATWQPTIEVDADVHEVRAHPTRAEIAVAAAAVGFCVSRDGGATWDVVADGLDATYARAVAFAGDDALVSVSDGPFAQHSTIYRARGVGDPAAPRPLLRVGDGLPDGLDGNVNTHCLAVAGDRMALGDGGGSVWVATGSAAWARAAHDLPDILSVVIV